MFEFLQMLAFELAFRTPDGFDLPEVVGDREAAVESFDGMVFVSAHAWIRSVN